MTVPSGYTATTDFWYRLDPAVDPDSVYFGLAETPETAEPNFRFVQITDMQVYDEETGAQHGDDLTEIEGLTVPPDFIAVTGDLVQTGQHDAQWQGYMAGELGHDAISIFHGYGDHDGLYSSGVDLEVFQFEKWIGPTCYSFDYGNIHFIMYNNVHPVSVDRGMTQEGWLFMDVFRARAQAMPEPLLVILFQHGMPEPEEVVLYASLFGEGVQGRAYPMGVFSGHWHGSRVRDIYVLGQGDEMVRIFDVNTPPSRMAGIDKSSRGFRIVDIEGGDLMTTFREAGVSDNLQIVTPAPDDTVLAGPMSILVNAYDSDGGELTVEYAIEGPGLSVPPTAMESGGGWSWRAEWDATDEEDGLYEITVLVTPQNGAPFSREGEFLLSGGVFVSEPDAHSDWPSYKYDAAGTGRRLDNLVPPLRLAWSRYLGGPINVPSPAVAEGRVYIGTSNISTTDQAALFCLDAATGEPLWTLPTMNDIKSTPAVESGEQGVVDGTVYFSTSMGAVYAVSAPDGGVLWQAQLGDSLKRWEMTSPTVHDGMVYAGGAPAMAALDAATGEVVWSDAGSSTDFAPATYSAPAVDGDHVVFANKEGIYTYDRVTGDPVWEHSGNLVHRSVAIVDGRVYTAGGYFGSQTLKAYDLASGDSLYAGAYTLYESTSAPIVGPVAGGEWCRVVVGHGGGGTAGIPGRIESYTPPQPSATWTSALGNLITSSAPYKRDIVSVNSTPAWAGDYVYFGADDGILYCVDAESGDVLWSFALGVPIRSSPAIAGNMLFVNGSDGTLYAFVSTFIDVLGASGGGVPILRTRLVGNRPNPFNPWTAILFDVGPLGAAPQASTLSIYDITGRLVRRLVDDALEPGRHRRRWDGRNDAGSAVASGVYLYELRVGESVFRNKLVLTR
jgi:outer membrane protein assembly factor BamB